MVKNTGINTSIKTPHCTILQRSRIRLLFAGDRFFGNHITRLASLRPARACAEMFDGQIRAPTRHH